MIGQERIVRFSLLPVLLALGGCSVLPPRVPPPTYHDFGLQHGVPSTKMPMALGDATAPRWLDTGKILYRPAHDSTALRAYATQRWIAPPADLLAQYFHERLKVSSASGCRIDLQLNRFEQDFQSADSARALMSVRANAVDSSGQFLASHEFVLSMPTTPDVEGAVRGLSVLARHAVIAVLDWSHAQFAKDALCSHATGSSQSAQQTK